MVKIKQTKNRSKSKLNSIMENVATHCKISKTKNKKPNKLLNHVKLNVVSSDLDLTVNPCSINFVASRKKLPHGDNTCNNILGEPLQNNINMSFSKLFRQSKAQREEKQNSEGTGAIKKPGTATRKLTSKVLPVPLQSSKATRQNHKPGNASKKTAFPLPIAPPQTKKSAKTYTSNRIPKEQASLVVIPKPSQKTYESSYAEPVAPILTKKSKKTDVSNRIPKEQPSLIVIPKPSQKTYESSYAEPVAPILTKKSKKTDVSNRIPKEQPSLMVIPKPSQKTYESSYAEPVAPILTKKSKKTDVSNRIPKEQPSLIVIPKPSQKTYESSYAKPAAPILTKKSKKTDVSNGMPKQPASSVLIPQEQRKTNGTSCAIPIAPTQTKKSKKNDVTNEIQKQKARTAVIPKPKRKTYENGWTVEDMGETSNTENESSDSDRDSYLDQFFGNDDIQQHEPETKSDICSSKTLKPLRSMLLASRSSQTYENSDDSSEDTQTNLVKLKKKSKRLEEQSISEMVPYFAPENGDDEITSDSEYDPTKNGDDEMTSESEYDPSWNTSSDDQYEEMVNNEYIEYSAEEVEFGSEESGTEYESTDSEYSESEDDGFSDECMSDEATYNSEDDEDYVPGINDDLFISRGDAKMYDICDNNISFNSDEGAQIFEITNKGIQVTSDNESCPDLVPLSPSKETSLKNPIADIYSSVVNDILQDSENEELNSDNSSDDFISMICSYQMEDVSMDTSTINGSGEEEHQFSRKSKFYNSPVSPHLVLLHLKEIVYFHGQFNVTLVHGSATSFGYEFKLNKPIEFYSPNCDSLLYLRPVDSGKLGKLNVKSLEEYFGQDIIKEIAEELSNSSGGAIMLLEYYGSKRVDSIRLFMRDEIFPVTQEHHTTKPFHLSEIRLRTNFIFSDSVNYSGYRKMETEAAWSKIPVNPNSRLMVIGGKSVGKSSLIKYLINSKINRMEKILFIDFDIGQPELYIPQTISATVIDFPILGPGCLHKVIPKKVLLFGDISVTSEQIKYIHACNTLIQYCTSNEELSAMPWVINTMGYNKGLGDEIIAAYIKTIKPTDVVQINSPRNADNFNQLFTPQFTNQFQFNMFTQEFKDNTAECNHNFIPLEAYSKMYERNVKGLLSAKDKRLMMILAHLGDILEVSDAKWLTDVEVKKINLNDLHIFTSYSLDKFGCTASLLKAVLDMTFVYLCNKNNDMSTDTTADCIGVGLVRHVDNEMGTLYLITAASDDDLELVNALALTNVTIAKAILEKQSVLVCGDIKSIELSDNFIGTRQVQAQTYRPDTTVNTRNNFVKE